MIIVLLWILFAWMMLGYPIYFYFFRAPKARILTNLILWVSAILGFFHYIGHTGPIPMKLGTLLLNLGSTLVFGFYFYKFKPRMKSLLSWLDVFMLNSYLFLFILMLIDLINFKIGSLSDDFVGSVLGIICVLAHLIFQYSYRNRTEKSI